MVIHVAPGLHAGCQCDDAYREADGKTEQLINMIVAMEAFPPTRTNSASPGTR